jgi:putative tricarboxylic transport membrane protein
MLEMWWAGFQNLLQARELMFLGLGMIIGLFFGAIPGLGGGAALALIAPLTYGLEPLTALALAGGVMGAVPMGGSITAILLNAPGTAPSAATCLDGYPLAQQGKAGLALGAAASANALGGIIGTVSVLAILPIAKQLVLLFGPPELFLLAVLGLIIVSTSTRGKFLRGLMTGCFGLLTSFVGYNDISGVLRFTGGVQYLWDGVHLVPALIGLFAVAEMIQLSITGGTIAKGATSLKITSITSGLMETFRHWPTVLRGSLIGTVIGAIPGVGGTVASFLSYSMTARASKDPESFGSGNIEGVIAPEAAINAKDGSCLIPTLAFGIPGGIEMAVFLGLLVMHGLQPGPLMLMSHQVEIYGLIWALTGACILGSCVGLLLARPLARLTLIDSQVLVPVVTAVALLGSWAVDRSIENVVITAVFGILGNLMIRFDYPRLTLVVAMVLGAAAERNFHQTAMMGDGGLSIYLHRTPSLILVVGIAGVLLGPPIRGLFGRQRSTAAQPEAAR